MKKIILLLSLSLILVSCSKTECESDNEAVCLIDTIEDFDIEEDANIKIGVFNEKYGEFIVEQLNNRYNDVYSYELIDEASDTSNLDIIQTMVSDVPLIYETLSPIDAKFDDLLKSDYLYKFSKEVNQIDNYFIPLEVKGILFAYNKTFLEAVGVSMNDSNDDNLPDSISSFEKIGELAQRFKDKETTYLDEPIEKVFSFPFDEPLSMISFIENSEYKLIQGVSGEDLNVGEDLKNALQTFKDLNIYPWHFNEESLKNMGWDYEESLVSQSAPFLLVGNWMFYDQYQSSKAYELVFSKLPTINNKEIETLSSVSGFVLKKDSLYPNAQQQFIKHIKGLDGTEALIDSGLIPVIDPLLLEAYEEEIDLNIKEQVKAYTYSHTPELHAFEKDPSVKAFNIYYDVDFRNLWKQMFLEEITVDDAYTQMVDKINEWLEAKGLKIEGEEHELEDNN